MEAPTRNDTNTKRYEQAVLDFKGYSLKDLQGIRLDLEVPKTSTLKSFEGPDIN